ncbi:RICIN domain-containing protein [Actinoplanes sp. NPDC024001]|uniref:RICIN domain-containing protein n=1 Tax=Actinoplanes sp. NPDC024001 TaxID=3154598 RepID=UPI0033F89857
MATRRALVLLVAAAHLGAPTPAAAAPAPPPLLQGWLVTGEAPGRCLTGGVVGVVLHTAACRPESPAQGFYQTSDGHFTNNGNCVRPDSLARGAIVRVVACNYQDDQAWWFTTTLRAGRFGRCLTEVAVSSAGQGTVRLRDCTGAATQRWRTHTPR